MSPQEYIESGILELYVYGALSESENEEVIKMSAQYPEISEEILRIEHALLILSSSITPKLSGKNYEKIKLSIFDENLEKEKEIIYEKSKPGFARYLGWIIALALLFACIYFYLQYESEKKFTENLKEEQYNLEQQIIDTELKNRQNYTYLSIIRNPNNKIVQLEGQDAAPKAFAKIYWNTETSQIYVDGLHMPEPPEGMIYQVWALKLNPLTPLSIGFLEDFKNHSTKFFQVDNVVEAEAFGITLEPAGGSPIPTIEQLFVLGKM